MSTTSDYVEMVENMTANELFDNFDEFCQLDQQLLALHSYYQNPDKSPDINIDLLQMFDQLADNKEIRTAPTQESPTVLRSSPGKRIGDKLGLSDLFSKSNSPSLKCCKNAENLTGGQIIEGQKTDESFEEEDDEPKYELEKHILINENNFISPKNIDSS